MDILNNWKSIENALDAASMRQDVIANNIANAGSPNFKTQAVAFETEMQKAMAGKDDGLDLRPVSLDEDIRTGNSNYCFGSSSEKKVTAKVVGTGQAVDINKEMVNLAKNQIQYNLLADKIGGSLSTYTKVFDELGR